MISEAYLYKYMPVAERYLLEALPPDEELDHKFSRRFERKMKALIKYERRTPWERKFYPRMKIAFVTIAVILLVVFGSAMSVKAYRSRIIEFFIEVFTDKTSYSVQEESPEGVAVVPVEPDYVPEGYEVVRRVNSYSELFIRYENATGDTIRYNQVAVSAAGRFWDTERSVTDEVKVEGKVVYVIEENAMRILYWNDEKYVYRIAGPSSLEVEVLLKTARRVMKKVE